MKILFFDATQDWIEVGTCSFFSSGSVNSNNLNPNNFILHYRISYPSVKESSFRLILEIEKALQESQWDKPDLIVFCDGPGSFTGVRITVTSARNLSQLWKIPLFPIHSVDLYSLGLALKHYKTVFLALDGKQGKYFYGGFSSGAFLSIQDLEPKKILEILERADFSKSIFAVSGNVSPFSNPDLLNLNENLPHFFEALQTDVIRSLLTKDQFSNYTEVLPFYLRGTYVD